MWAVEPMDGWIRRTKAINELHVSYRQGCSRVKADKGRSPVFSEC
jgi:hypothetical protein